MVRKKMWSFTVFVDEKSEENMLKAEHFLNEELPKYGVRLVCSPSRQQGRKGLRRYALTIRLDGETAGRHAGRKRAETAYGMGEAMAQEAAGKDKKSIAEEMGISLASYYRRRKEHIEKHGAGDSPE